MGIHSSTSNPWFEQHIASVSSGASRGSIMSINSRSGGPALPKAVTTRDFPANQLIKTALGGMERLNPGQYIIAPAIGKLSETFKNVLYFAAPVAENKKLATSYPCSISESCQAIAVPAMNRGYRSVAISCIATGGQSGMMAQEGASQLIRSLDAAFTGSTNKVTITIAAGPKGQPEYEALKTALKEYSPQNVKIKLESCYLTELKGSYDAVACPCTQDPNEVQGQVATKLAEFQSQPSKTELRHQHDQQKHFQESQKTQEALRKKQVEQVLKAAENQKKEKATIQADLHALSQKTNCTQKDRDRLAQIIQSPNYEALLGPDWASGPGGRLLYLLPPYPIFQHTADMLRDKSQSMTNTDIQNLAKSVANFITIREQLATQNNKLGWNEGARDFYNVLSDNICLLETPSDKNNFTEIARYVDALSANMTALLKDKIP